jgi:FkbM family methyltransferase
MIFNKILRRLKKLLGVLLDKYYTYSIDQYNYHCVAFSQEGEDLILARFFEGQAKGFYVDIGAHHPQRFSNTYYFYLKGWKGINIDARPNSMKVFNILRPNDINLEIPISDKSEVLTYYEFDDPALNSFSYDLSQQRVNDTNYKIVSKLQLKVQTLAEVLDKHLLLDQKIDFLSIDVEGLDYQVLASNNWEKYKPKVVLVEDLELSSLENINISKIYFFLEKKGYILIAKTIRTLIFRLQN